MKSEDHLFNIRVIIILVPLALPVPVVADDDLDHHGLAAHDVVQLVNLTRHLFFQRVMRE